MLPYAVLVLEKETGAESGGGFLKSYTNGRAKMPLRSSFQSCALPAKGSWLIKAQLKDCST